VGRHKVQLVKYSANYRFKPRRCIYCGWEFQSIKSNHKFCCANHQIYFNRDQREMKELLAKFNKEPTDQDRWAMIGANSSHAALKGVIKMFK